jgi:hypothetical protein
MKSKPNNKKQVNQHPVSSNKKTNRILIGAGLLLAGLAAYMFWPLAETVSEENNYVPVPATSTQTPVADKEKLVGRWQRTDGGYVIELKNPDAAGLIEAGYFNPNPINVGKAAWQNKSGKLMVMVELRDQNYPGSIYNLEYQPQGDKLTGVYFQAVEKVSYNVEFIRVR